MTRVKRMQFNMDKEEVYCEETFPSNETVNVTMSSNEFFSSFPDSREESILKTKIYSPPAPLLPLPSVNESEQQIFQSENLGSQSPEESLDIANNWSHASYLLHNNRQQYTSLQVAFSNCHGTMKPPEWFTHWRRELLNILFTSCTLNLNKINDNVIFSTIDLFDRFINLQMLQFHSGNEAFLQNSTKETMAAALILVSKLDNMGCEIFNIPSTSRVSVLEKEISLFLHASQVLYQPSCWLFLCAFLGYNGQDERVEETKINSSSIAYNLAVYILSLNLTYLDSRQWSAQQLGAACAWIVTLLLHHPTTLLLQEIVTSMDSEEYSIICHQIMKRALQLCQNESFYINKFFSTPSRFNVSKILRKAARTTTGSNFLTDNVNQV